MFSTFQGYRHERETERDRKIKGITKERKKHCKNKMVTFVYLNIVEA